MDADQVNAISTGFKANRAVLIIILTIVVPVLIPLLRREKERSPPTQPARSEQLCPSWNEGSRRRRVTIANCCAR